MIPTNLQRKIRYAALGVILGAGAPVTWMFIKVLFFAESSLPLIARILQELTGSSENIALYAFMGFGTSIVMGGLGFFIGKSGDELNERAAELDQLHSEVNHQKELFENRYKVLDNNIKNFHQISKRIQKSPEIAEVLSLCAEGLHDILGYERVNIFVVDEARENLRFMISTGADEDVTGYRIPLDDRGGVIFKCFKEKRLFLIDDITKFPEEFHLKPPFSSIKAIRSSNFILCPVVIKGEAVAVFGVDNKYSKRALNDTDVDTVRLFVDQASSSVVRINLLKAIATLTTELEKSFSGILNRREDYSSDIIVLEGAVASLASDTRNIASSAESVLGAVAETSSAVAQISVAIDQVSQSLDSLTETACKSASAMEEISASVRNVEESAAISYTVSSQVKAQADEGRAVVQEAAEALSEIQKAVDFSYNGIMRLTENSTRIDNIVNVINDITKRTNLLALNASIIAAQAGEYGRSFGVVADEIRNLSLQTGQSTDEITSIIEDILHESRIAAENITLTKQLVQQGVSLGLNTGDSLDTIIASAMQSLSMTEEIKLATREQSIGVDLVTRSIEDVSAMISKIFNVSKEQANATRSIAQSITTIKKMAEEMAAATAGQVRGGKDIRKSVDGVAMMVHDIFNDLESRKSESNSVVDELEMMRGSMH